MKGHRVAQDWRTWASKGYIDMVNISGYCYRKNYGDRYLKVFEKRLRGAVEINKALGSPVEITFCLGIRTSHGHIPRAQEVEDAGAAAHGRLWLLVWDRNLRDRERRAARADAGADARRELERVRAFFGRRRTLRESVTRESLFAERPGSAGRTAPGAAPPARMKVAPPRRPEAGCRSPAS